jgi:hypothetical protein
MFIFHLLTPFLFCVLVQAQTAGSVAEVHRVYVAVTAKPALAGIGPSLMRDLEKSGTIQVVQSPAQADAVLSADGDIYVKGYVSLNPRSGNSPGHGEPVRAGYLSVELKGKGGETLWSFLATPRFGSTNIEREISRQVTKELVSAVRAAKKP